MGRRKTNAVTSKENCSHCVQVRSDLDTGCDSENVMPSSQDSSDWSTSVADPEVRPLGLLDTIMRKMTNNNNVIFEEERISHLSAVAVVVDSVFVKTNTRLLACVYVAL